MPIPNKFTATCCDCNQLVWTREGLSDKPENLGLKGEGWLTRHKGCSWKERIRRPVMYSTAHSCSTPDPFDDGFDNWCWSGGATEYEFLGDVGDKG